MSKKIRRLTPSLLKKIIAEEKRKIIKESKVKTKKSSRGIAKQKRVLKETKKMQKDLVLKFKKLYQLREKIKRNLNK
jgi:hypothetical protein